MTEANLERDRLRWLRRACAPALLAALGCTDTSVEPAADARTPSAVTTHTPRQAEIAWARPLMPPTAEGIEPAGMLSLPPSASGEARSHKQVEAPTLPELTPLPAVKVGVEEEAPTPEPESTPTASSGPTLLPPQPISESFTEWEEPAAPIADATITPTPEILSAPSASAADDRSLVMPPTMNVTSDDQGESLSPEADELLADADATVTGHPTGAMVTEQAQTKIRRGYKLAQRGAYFAARQEFVEVLRMIAEAKDQKRGVARRSIALANGLRALETVFESEAVLLRTRKPVAAAKEAQIAGLLSRIDGVLATKESKYIMLNAPGEALAAISALLPGAEAPTILPLHQRPGHFAVHAVCQESVFWETLQKLKATGASAILVLPIEKMMM